MRWILFAILSITSTAVIYAQKGGFAGIMKSKKGLKFPLNKLDNQFVGWQNIGGYFLTFQEGATNNITIDFYKKGTIQLVILSLKNEKTGIGNIEDIIEVKNVFKNRYIQSATCSVNKADPDIEIIALEEAKGKTGKIIQAWRANRKKLQFEAIEIDGINCYIEGAD